MIRIYSDGGCIGANPSPKGGTVAWCHVDDAGRRIRHDAFVVLPSDWGLPTITNNLTELLAAVSGLLALPDGERAEIYTDSKITLCRLRYAKAKMNGIPPRLQEMVAEARERIYFVGHLAGHPTAEEVRQGMNAKGRPVSEHNVFCDSECNRVMRAWKRGELVTTGV